MGIFSGLLGNASEVDNDELEQQFEQILCKDERIEQAFKLIRDLFVFTNKRMILVDKQGVTGKKTEYLSIPYKSVVKYSIESSGHFDLDAELKIWLSGQHEPIEQEFKNNGNVTDIYRIITQYTCK